MQIGQAKDASAMFLFGVAFLTVLNKNVPKSLILTGLGMGFIVDGLYTLNPSWHCADWEDGPLFPKFSILIQNIIVVGLALKTILSDPKSHE
jgi:hypothetical protein